MEPLKNAYDRAYLEGLAAELGATWGELDQRRFVADVLAEGWDLLELKGRMRRISETLDAHLPDGLAEALTLLDPAVASFGGYMALFFPDLVELRAVRELGIAGHPTIELDERAAKPSDNAWPTLVAALARYTPHSSSEFAVRPLIVHDQARMLAEHLAWTASDNHHLRRLASEGCRPRLPWAMALPALKRDPAPLLPILEALRFDESEYVRRSVANNLNDIAKDHPDLVREVAARWLAEAEQLPATREEAGSTNAIAKSTAAVTGGDAKSDAKTSGLGTRPDDNDHGPQTTGDRHRLVKHACRTLLKAGDAATMLLFGFRDPAEVAVQDLALDAPTIAIGERLEFSFTLEAKPRRQAPGGNAAATLGRLRLEYAVHYRKKNGSLSPKVFKISEFETDEPRRTLTRRHAFRDLSIRKHHPGSHELAVIVNGVEKARVGFEVVAPE